MAGLVGVWRGAARLGEARQAGRGIARQVVAWRGSACQVKAGVFVCMEVGRGGLCVDR